jgi:hypothetical protein
MSLFLTRQAHSRFRSAGPERCLADARYGSCFRQSLNPLDELALKRCGLRIVVSGTPQIKRDDGHIPVIKSRIDGLRRIQAAYEKSR